MGKQLPATRLLHLMNTLGWRDYTDWRSLPKAVQEENIVEFKVWLRDHLDYITPVRVRTDFERYYFKNESESTGSGFYIRLDQARAALKAIYQKEQEAVSGYRTRSKH